MRNEWGMKRSAAAVMLFAAVCALVAAPLMVTLGGCASKNLMKASATPEDKADNLAQIFKAYQDQVVTLVQNPVVPKIEKVYLAQANQYCALGAKALLDASSASHKAKDAIAAAKAAGKTPDLIAVSTADGALQALEDAIRTYEKPILGFKKRSIANGAKP